MVPNVEEYDWVSTMIVLGPCRTHSHNSTFFSKDFFELPFDVTHTIMKTFTLLPVDEWEPLLYACRTFNDRLSAAYLLRSGLFATTPRPSDLGCRTTLYMSSTQSFQALRHWRRSTLFHPVESAIVTFSSDSKERDSQFGTLEHFFMSLPLGFPHIRSVHLDFSDFTTPVNISALERMMGCIGRTGCSSLFIHSIKDYPSSLEAEVDDHGEDDSIVYPLHLKVLDVESSVLCSGTLSRWFFRTLRACSQLETLHLSGSGLSIYQWSQVLPLLHFPRLRKLHIEHVGMRALARFLVRHRSVEEIDLSGLIIDVPSWLPIQSEIEPLPLLKLKKIIGEGRSLRAFFTCLSPECETLQDVSFQGDQLTDEVVTFDTSAHLHALRDLAGLQSRKLQLLSIFFPSIPEFSSSSFFERYEESISTGARISVHSIDIHLRCNSVSDCEDLLVSRAPYSLLKMSSYDAVLLECLRVLDPWIFVY